MNDPARETYIVRPFGVIGGDYEVDAAGRRKYRIACGLVPVAIAIGVIGPKITSMDMVFGLGAVCILITAALCVEVTRKGNKLR